MPTSITINTFISLLSVIGYLPQSCVTMAALRTIKLEKIRVLHKMAEQDSKNSKDEIREFYNRWAETYEKEVVPVTFNPEVGPLQLTWFGSVYGYARHCIQPLITFFFSLVE